MTSFESDSILIPIFIIIQEPWDKVIAKKILP